MRRGRIHGRRESKARYRQSAMSISGSDSVTTHRRRFARADALEVEYARNVSTGPERLEHDHVALDVRACRLVAMSQREDAPDLTDQHG